MYFKIYVEFLVANIQISYQGKRDFPYALPCDKATVSFGSLGKYVFFFTFKVTISFVFMWSFNFSIDLTLAAALRPWGRLSL
jgi:hypothetical protein